MRMFQITNKEENGVDVAELTAEGIEGSCLFPIDAMIAGAKILGRDFVELIEVKVRSWLPDVSNDEMQKIVRMANS